MNNTKENIATAVTENHKELLKKLEEAIKEKNVWVFYPVYINTYALTYVLKDVKRLRLSQFNWGDVVPKNLENILNLDEDETPDIIFCFSSTDKENFFREEVQKILTKNNLKYKISKPEVSGVSEVRGIDCDIRYSNFFLKYLFFQNKINIDEIYNLGKLFYTKTTSEHPYVNKLLSILLARGYQTIHIETDVRDESKGLLRKVLHEEYGFKFKLTPNLIEFKTNNTLVVEAKGGQQSFEELKLQENNLNGKQPKSDKYTFVIHDNFKNTSATKLITIYKGNSKAYSSLHELISDLSRLIFDKTINSTLFDEETPKNFLLNNIQFVTDEIRHPDNTYSEEKFENVKSYSPFLKSLDYYIPGKKVKELFEQNIKYNNIENIGNDLFLKLWNDTDGLQVNTKENFIQCLNDHHVDKNKAEESKSFCSVEGESKLNSFCKSIYKNYVDVNRNYEKDSKIKILANGLFILKLVISNPYTLFNEAILDTDDKKEECIQEFKAQRLKFLNYLEKSSEIQPIDTSLYYSLMIIAEDLNYLIVDEALLGNPKFILKIVEGFDITEFEYLYSIELSKLIHNTNPDS